MKITVMQKSATIADLAELRKQRAELDNKIKDAEALLISQMQHDHTKSVEHRDGGKRYTATYVQGYTTVINEVGLRKALSAKVYDKYTTKRLDRAKLEQAMEAGEIDQVTVLAHAENRPNKPYLRFTESTVKDDD